MPHQLFGTLSIGQFLHHLATELLIFLVTEFLVRIFIPNTARKADRIKLLVIQGSLLLAASLILHLFQHRPILLMALALFIFIKLMFVSSAHDTSDEYISHNKVSKPLPKSVNDETASVTFQSNEPWVGGTWPWYNWRAPGMLPHPPEQPTTPLVTAGWREPSWHNLSRRPVTQSTPPHQASGFTATAPKVSAVVASQKGTSGGYQSSNYHPSHRPTLQRSPLLNSSVFQHTAPYFSYLSSLWDHKRSSNCPPGIRNAGNTCFVNSTLQSLARTPGFLQALSIKKDTASSSSALLKSLHSLLDKCSVSPDGSGGYIALDAAEFLGSTAQRAPHLVASPQSGERQSQQDAAEFLLWLLDSLHDDIPHTNTSAAPQDHPDVLKMKKEAYSLELQLANSDDLSTFRDPLIKLASVDWDLKSKNSSSSIHDLFLGQIVEARECQNCKKMSVNVEYFTVLPLPIPRQSPSVVLGLEQCFDCFGSVEELDSSNMMTCSCIPLQEKDELILTPGKRIAMLSRLPKRLIVQLTRFSYCPKLKSVTKNITHIAIPTTIDITSYVMENKLHSNLSTQKTVLYKLYAFCTHAGAQSTSFGHYMAYCLASNGIWYCFNDRHVSEVKDIENELLTTFILQNAYILFYTI